MVDVHTKLSLIGVKSWTLCLTRWVDLELELEGNNLWQTQLLFTLYYKHFDCFLFLVEVDVRYISV